MSEYQYYEFQTVDRPLTEREMRQLRTYSTRAVITPTRFVNHYEWGDFKGNPSAWMEKYFDVFLYFANWGSRDLMLRLPSRVFDLTTAKRYCRGESASVRAKGNVVILEFHSENEDGDSWDDDGSGWLSSLTSIRGDIASGDYRALYLAWLLCAQNGELKDREIEPPIPPGLGKLTAPLKAFADFLRIDGNLIAAAAQQSARTDDKARSTELKRRISELPETEKTTLLFRLATGNEHNLSGELLRRLYRTNSPKNAGAQNKPRTVSALLREAERRANRQPRGRKKKSRILF